MDTSELKIIIFSYAYRDKRIVETIKSAIDLCDSTDNIGISLIIQDSYQHEINLNKELYLNKIEYRNWNNFAGFVHHRHNALKTIDDPNIYFLFVMPGTIFSKSWDKKIVDFIQNNLDKSLSYEDDKFSLYGTLINSHELAKIQYPFYLKMLGEEEDISIKLYCNNHQIISGIQDIITRPNPKTWDYIPFSISHRYAQTQKLFLDGRNNFCEINEKYKEYAEKYPLKQIFDQRNDSLYTNKDIALGDNVDRFLNYKTTI